MAGVSIVKKRLLSYGRSSRLNRTDGFQWMLVLILSLFSLFMLLPIVYIFNHSLKPYSELFAYPPAIFVQHPTFQNFRELFLISNSSLVPVSRYVFNSIFVAIVVVVGMIMVSSLCAYPLSKHKFPGHRLFFAIILLSLMFAPETVVIPRYLVIVRLHLMNTYWGHILPHLAAPVSVFLMKQFFDQVPNELLEAGKIDGAGEWTLFLRVLMPLCMPAVATIAILSFQNSWANVETSSFFMQEESMRTFPFFLSTLTNGLANDIARQGAAAAATLILFLPNFIIFLLFQRKVIATMAHSGIK